MTTLTSLRKLAYQQQYSELKEEGRELWQVSQDTTVLPLLAMAYARLGEMQEAGELIEQAWDVHENRDDSFRIDLAAALIVTQHYDKAVLLLEPLQEQSLVQVEVNAQLGYCRMAQGDLEGALILFLRSVAEKPNQVTVLNNLARVYQELSHYGLAIQIVNQARQALHGLENELPADVVARYGEQIDMTQLRIWTASEGFAEAEFWLQQQKAKLEEKQLVGWFVKYGQLLAERDKHKQAVEFLQQQLTDFPDNVELCLKLAELAQVQGYYMQSVNLLHRALKQDENNITLWAQLSGACLQRFDHQARQAAEHAMSLAYENELSSVQQRLMAKHALAQVESHEQNFELAEQLYREVLAESEHFVPALEGLGQQLMQQGRIDEALTMFERIKQRNPLKGYTALINARQFPEDDHTLEKLAAAAQVPSLEGSLRSGILFQLAAAWQKRKHYDKAFEFARKANEASKKLLPYDRKTHRNQCARVRQRYSRALYDHRSDCGVDSNVPVYVVGMPRSGTTLVEQILSGHSEIFGAGELGVIPQVIQGLERWERHVGSGRSYPDCVDDLSPRVVEGIANNVLAELKQYAPDARHIVDKLPHNFENIGLIKFLFPKAKIISVRRDPRDIAISNYFTDYQAKHGGMGFAYDLSDIGEQLADHNLMMHHWHQIFPGEILELNYEDVVDDLEGSARKLLDYIGVQWQPQVLKFNELERTVKTASVWQVRQPIYKTSKAKWKHYHHYLRPLINGTNARISPDPYSMMTLPEPGFLTQGVDLFHSGDLDGAELSFKKMLHHNPEHAACQYMVGLVYLRKGYLAEGIGLIEKALEKAPWQKEWRANLVKACESLDRNDKARQLAIQCVDQDTQQPDGNTLFSLMS